MEKITNDYAKVFTEVDEILSHLPEELLDKLPAKLKKEIKENKDTEYEFKYNQRKELMNQDIYEQTKDFISFIYIMYICNKTEKKQLLEACKENERRQEQLKKRKYTYASDKLFKRNKTEEPKKENKKKETKEVKNDTKETTKNKDTKEPKKNTKEEKALTPKEEETWYTKILNKIKDFFKKS